MSRTTGAKCLTTSDKAKILQKVLDGEKPAAIAQEMKIGPNTVYRICKRKAGGIRKMLYGI